MRYEPVKPIRRQTAEKAFRGSNEAAISNALLSLTFHDPDWKWVQERCLQFSHHQSYLIRRMAALCLGHLARIHGQLDLLEVIEVLEQLKLDPLVAGYAENALEDIGTFIKTH